MKAARMGAALALAASVILVAPVSSSAAGLTDCDPKPPRVSFPDEGMGALFNDRPTTPQTSLSSDNVWSHGGFGGMDVTLYDVGCWKDPSTYFEYADSATSAANENLMIAIGNFITMTAGATERKVWEPTWLTSFVKQFSDRAFEIIDTRVWATLSLAGLMLASVFLIYAGRRGDISSVLNGVAAIIAIMGIMTILLVNPAFIPQTVQRASSEITIALNNSKSNTGPDANMDSTVRSVQYNSYLRRTFGSENGEMAKKYGTRLLAAKRASWAEAQATANDPAARDALVKLKGEHYEAVMADIKKESEGTYLTATGNTRGSSSSVAGLTGYVELLFALTVSFFRFCAAFVMIVDISAIIITSLIFVTLSFALVSPPAFRYGRSMIDTVGRASIDALKCAVGLWIFNVWMDICFAPGISAWWGILLLTVGSILLWGFIRPDRALMSLLSFGRVGRYGRLQRWLSAAAASAAGNYAADWKQRRDGSDDRGAPMPRPDTPPPPPSAGPAGLPPAPARSAPAEPDIYEATVTSVRRPQDDPQASWEPARQVVPGRVVARSLPSGEPPYEREPREDRATAPMAGSSGEIEIYRRDADATAQDNDDHSEVTR